MHVGRQEPARERRPRHAIRERDVGQPRAERLGLRAPRPGAGDDEPHRGVVGQRARRRVSARPGLAGEPWQASEICVLGHQRCPEVARRRGDPQVVLAERRAAPLGRGLQARVVLRRARANRLRRHTSEEAGGLRRQFDEMSPWAEACEPVQDLAANNGTGDEAILSGERLDTCAHGGMGAGEMAECGRIQEIRRHATRSKLRRRTAKRLARAVARRRSPRATRRRPLRTRSAQRSSPEARRLETPAPGEACSAVAQQPACGVPLEFDAAEWTA